MGLKIDTSVKYFLLNDEILQIFQNIAVYFKTFDFFDLRHIIISLFR